MKSCAGILLGLWSKSQSGSFTEQLLFLREQDNCPPPAPPAPRRIIAPRTIAPQDNCLPDNCPPKIATPEIVPRIISPWTIGAQTIAPQNTTDMYPRIIATRKIAPG